MVADKENGAADKTESFTNLYVKCFPQDYNEKDLCDLFSGCGPIQAAKVMNDPRGRKFAFVTFEKPEDAKSCIEEMHCKDLRSRKEQKAAAKALAAGEAPPPVVDADGHPEHLLYVGRAQSKAERQAMLEKQWADKGKGAPKGDSKGKGKGGTVFYGKGGDAAAAQSGSAAAAAVLSSSPNGHSNGTGATGASGAHGSAAMAASMSGGNGQSSSQSSFFGKLQQQQMYGVNGGSYGDNDSNGYSGHGAYGMNGGYGGVSGDNSYAGASYDWSSAYSGDSSYGASYQQMYQMQLWHQQMQQQQQQYWAQGV
eukprot:TRINITY_DN36612_c0_g2_i1.p2 TRINITY_DN36612_c0_g2~~TRINITY_DN36612_c0_g2_i1.p2  ORF type:complete len:310 (+),score=87.56 TRINITY_DN36612_c0_g2_i1:116-1045(+)